MSINIISLLYVIAWYFHFVTELIVILQVVFPFRRISADGTEEFRLHAAFEADVVIQGSRMSISFRTFVA